jgi:hypothetical protein
MLGEKKKIETVHTAPGVGPFSARFFFVLGSTERS